MSQTGIIIFLIGAAWLIVLSLRLEISLLKRILWAAAILIFNPIAGISFFMFYKKGLIAMILCLVGFVLVMFGGIPLDK